MRVDIQWLIDSRESYLIEQAFFRGIKAKMKQEWISWLNEKTTVARLNRRILNMIEDDIEKAWPLIETVFAASRNIHSGPTGVGAVVTPQARILECLASKGADAESLLIAHANHPNAKVAAYCLAGLQRMGSERLMDAARTAMCRTEDIRWSTGAFIQCLPLGRLAEQLCWSIESKHQ